MIASKTLMKTVLMNDQKLFLSTSSVWCNDET